MIKIESISYSYRNKSLPHIVALDKINLTIDSGEFVVLTGPNGSGKSTLFRILCGLLQPSRGTVTIHGVDLLQHPQRARQSYGIVFQKPALDSHLSIFENCAIHAALYGMSRQQLQQRLQEDLSWTSVADRLHQPVKTLSGGMARQVELVKSLLHRPRCLLMDEPTTGLDPISRREFLQAVRRLQQQHQMTVLMTSHLFEEAEAADRMAILHQGQLLAHDTPDRLRATIGPEMVAVQSEHPDQSDHIWQDLKRRPGVVLQRHSPTELWCEHAQLPEMLYDLLQHHRQFITSLSFRRPTLEDVFVHVTRSHEEQQR
ncbi:MAG: ABC transporter ATP-binding protein [Magnetococcales bacterium]|nr:ABC transporter ATP-binding protein [Magnetococcales bacterium]